MHPSDGTDKSAVLGVDVALTDPSMHRACCRLSRDNIIAVPAGGRVTVSCEVISPYSAQWRLNAGRNALDLLQNAAVVLLGLLLL